MGRGFKAGLAMPRACCPVSTSGQGISRWKNSHWDHPNLPSAVSEVKDLLCALASYRSSRNESIVPP